MFGWKRKKDGFEWHDYVRTTILVRRAKRREHLHDVQQKAFGEVENARRRSVKAGADGLKAFGHNARYVLNASSQEIPRYAAVTGRSIVRFSHWLGRTFWRGVVQVEKASSAAWQGLGRLVLRAVPRRLALPLAVIGIASVTGSIAQLTETGLTTVSLVTGALGIIAIGIAAMCWGQSFKWPLDAGSGSGRTFVFGGNTLADIWQPLARWTGLAGSVLLVGLLIWSTIYYVAPQSGALTGLFNGPWPQISFGSLFEGERVTGRAKALSGDTLSVRGVTIQLSGVEAPLPVQTCKGAKRRDWKCGVAAARALSKLIRRSDVSCSLAETLESGLRNGTCKVDNVDVAAKLVEQGFVFAQSGWFSGYGALEDLARKEKIGLWRGAALRPEDYRASQWETASKKAPDGCPIKGRALSRGKFYLLPWSKRYHAYSVRRRRGDRWFCSERDALQAGWKPMDRG